MGGVAWGMLLLVCDGEECGRLPGGFQFDVAGGDAALDKQNKGAAFGFFQHFELGFESLDRRGGLVIKYDCHRWQTYGRDCRTSWWPRGVAARYPA